MKKWFFRIFWVPVFVLAVLFLVANRQPVAVSLDPFSASNPAVTTAALPLWLWLMLMLFIGLGMGAAGMWLSGAERRRNYTSAKKELKVLKKEVTTLRQAAASHDNRQASEPEALPVLEAASN